MPLVARQASSEAGLGCKAVGGAWGGQVVVSPLASFRLVLESPSALPGRDPESLQCRLGRACLHGSPGGITSGGGQRAPDDKHMALKANSGWHQLLKVTLY